MTGPDGNAFGVELMAHVETSGSILGFATFANDCLAFIWFARKPETSWNYVS